MTKLFQLLIKHFNACKIAPHFDLEYGKVKPKDLDFLTTQRDLFVKLKGLNIVPRLVMITKCRQYFAPEWYDYHRTHYINTSFLYSVGKYTEAQNLHNSSMEYPLKPIVAKMMLEMLDEHLGIEIVAHEDEDDYSLDDLVLSDDFHQQVSNLMNDTTIIDLCRDINDELSSVYTEIIIQDDTKSSGYLHLTLKPVVSNIIPGQSSNNIPGKHIICVTIRNKIGRWDIVVEHLVIHHTNHERLKSRMTLFGYINAYMVK